MKIGNDIIIDRLQQNNIENGRYRELGHLHWRWNDSAVANSGVLLINVITVLLDSTVFLFESLATPKYKVWQINQYLERR